MVNNTVNNIGKAAGIADKTIITGMQVMQTEKELEALGKTSRYGFIQEEFMSIKAYPGGNPNKARNNDNELTH